MEVLGELSKKYRELSDTDIRKVNLLNSVGGKLRATQLDALLRGWSDYETMLGQFADGAGSMAKEAEKTANSWEGSMNRLSNTWTDTIGNIANSSAITGLVNGLNGVLTFINKITGAVGSIGSIGLIGGLVAGFKNVGINMLVAYLSKFIVLNYRQYRVSIGYDSLDYMAYEYISLNESAICEESRKPHTTPLFYGN